MTDLARAVARLSRFLALATAITLPSAAPAANEGKMDILFDRFLDQFQADNGRTIAKSIGFHQVAGVSVVMIEGALPLEHRVWGERDIGQGKPTTHDTIYQAASLSKFVAALTIAGAHRREDVKINRSVDRFAELFPDSIVGKWRKQAFKGDQEDWPESITLRRLLSHSAGLDTHGIGHFADTAHCNSVKSIILGNVLTAACNGVKPIRSPGVQYEYSGGGYTVAESMLETETGRSFKGYAEDHVLNPFGMTRSTFDDGAKDMDNLARGCSQGKCKKDKVLTLKPKAAGGLLAHPEDFARLLHLIMYDGKDIAATGRLSTAPQVIPWEDIEQVLRPASHRDSTFNPCTNSCPGRPGLIWTNSLPTAGLRPEACYKSTCRENLSITPGDFTDDYYGLGAFLSQSTQADNLPLRFRHGGDQDNVANEVFARRDQKAGIVIFVNGEDSWTDDSGKKRGASVLATEILNAWRAETGL